MKRKGSQPNQGHSPGSAPSQIQDLIACGEGPPVTKLEHRRIIRRQSLLHWLYEREIAS